MNDSSTPRFLQGVYTIEGAGLEEPFLLDAALTYTVPPGSSTQPVYFRGGNSSDEMIYVTLARDGTPMRYFPIAAKGATHVSLRVVVCPLHGYTYDLLSGAEISNDGEAVRAYSVTIDVAQDVCVQPR